MVLFSARQKQILLAFLTEPNGLSLKEMEKQLHVSRRTLYREFSALRLFLEQNDLILTSQDGRYLLEGSAQNKQVLQVALSNQHSAYDLSSSQRQNAVAALLLLATGMTKIASLATDLNVSEGTIQHDLLTLTDSLAEYQLQVIKKKGVGVQISGSELKRRQVLCGILLTELNAYSFLRYLNDHDNSVSNFFMTLLPYQLLSACYTQLNRTVLPQINFYSDRQIISTVLMFTISLERLTHDQPISYPVSQTENLEYLGVTYKFFASFDWDSININVDLPKDEIFFLAEHLQNANVNVNSYDFNVDDFSVMIQVRELVELVSTAYGWDFRRNPEFFKRLSKHIENLIKNDQQQLPNVQIETLSGVSDRYSRLFSTVCEKWAEVFPDKQLTQPELQLLLLYFANEYTNRSYERELRALVICENGFSTSQILKSRLMREIPEIQQIDTSKVSDLHQIEPRDYDLILSTIDLPGFPRDYQVVSPLLLDNDVSKVKNWLQTYQKKYSSTTQEQTGDLGTAPVSVTPQALIEKEREVHLYNQLVQEFHVNQLDNTGESLQKITEKIVAQTPPTVITDQTDVVNNLLRRVKLAPIGIPDTNLAILHTATYGVKQPFCMIYELQEPFMMQAMDQEQIYVNRVLLLLAPYDLDQLTERTLGMISSLIIMNDENTALFEHGTTQELRSFLTEKFLAVLRN